MKFIFWFVTIVAAFCGFTQVFPKQAGWLKIKVEWLIAPDQIPYTIMGLIMLFIVTIALCLWARIRSNVLLKIK